MVLSAWPRERAAALFVALFFSACTPAASAPAPPHEPSVPRLRKPAAPPIQSVDVLPGIVAHELVHFEQRQSDQKTLLAASIREGSADFIGELVSGMNTNKHLRDYGLAHERELWAEMRNSLHGTDISRWLYNGDSSGDRPADLGYFVGARIAKAYYDRAADKKQAIRAILEATDYDGFLAQSGYGEQWR